MMGTTIYLIRHGQSEANERGAFLGHHDLNLTQIGRKQASVTADFLCSQGQHPNVIYSSDLIRAYETARCTAERFNMPIIKDKNLREIYAGYWENHLFTDIEVKFTESYNTWKTNIGLARCDGGESVEELQLRIVSAVTQIAQKHKNSTVFIFTHATPIRVFAAHCLKKTLDEMKTIPWATNASVTKVVYDNESFDMVEYSRDDFMEGIGTKLPANV